MFQGALALTLDAKGRMSIPSRHREALQLQAEDRVTVTKYPDGCLMLFPCLEQERPRERITAFSMKTHWRKRIFLGSAADVELDVADHILITPGLRATASLERDMMPLGMGNHLEVWDAATYIVKEQTAMTQGVPDALKNFPF